MKRRDPRHRALEQIAAAAKQMSQLADVILALVVAVKPAPRRQRRRP